MIPISIIIYSNADRRPCWLEETMRIKANKRKTLSATHSLANGLKFLNSRISNLEWRCLVTERILKERLGLGEGDIKAMIETMVKEQKHLQEAATDKVSAHG